MYEAKQVGDFELARELAEELDLSGLKGHFRHMASPCLNLNTLARGVRVCLN